MKIMILGADGYIGWPLTQYLLSKGHEVIAIDNCVKRVWERELDARPVLAVPSFTRRLRSVKKPYGDKLTAYDLDIAATYTGPELFETLMDHRPMTIVHLAEQPSAPFSMLNHKTWFRTMENNVNGTLGLIRAVGRFSAVMGGMPHIIKLGSMGEYGTPDGPIGEGLLTCCDVAQKAGWQMPKTPGSWYHVSKVHDSHNLEFACRTWGLRVTDINQGVVWGIDTDAASLDVPETRTSLHADEFFGTVFNRFVFQAACEQPLTVYGEGGQTRGFIALQDACRAIELVAQYRPAEGEFRVINQLTSYWSVAELADLIAKATGVGIQHVKNPRIEKERHSYDVTAEWLKDHGLVPSRDLTTKEVERIVALLRTDKRALRVAAERIGAPGRAPWRKYPAGEKEGSGI